MIDFPAETGWVLAPLDCRRTIPGSSLSNCSAFAYMPHLAAFSSRLVDEAAGGPYLPAR